MVLFAVARPNLLWGESPSERFIFMPPFGPVGLGGALVFGAVPPLERLPPVGFVGDLIISRALPF